MTSIILFTVLLGLLALNVPIAVSLGMASMIVMLAADGMPPLSLMARSVVTGGDSFPLIAVPLFILAGDIMQVGGLSRRLIGFVDSLVGHIRAGLAYVNVLACMFFAAISGSGPATVAAIGSNLIPEMRKKGYRADFSAALTASAGIIGVMIPPSIPFIIYGVSAETSIGDLFIAGVLPGVLFGLGFMAVSRFLLRRDDRIVSGASFEFKTARQSFLRSVWALVAPVIILGGIYGGVFTPTEAGAVAVVYAFVVGLFVYRDIGLKDLPGIFAQSALTSGTVLILVIMATTFGRLLTIARIPVVLANWMTGVADSQWLILLMINVFLLFVGMFMETISSIIILTPILLPVVKAVGVDPIHFGVILTVNLAVGFCTPPLGVNLFVANGVSGVSIERLTRAILPFFVVMAVLLAIVSYVPEVSLLLPNLLR